MAGIASFQSGVWNGEPHSDDFVKKLADNFQKYSAGSSPYYRPYVSLNHKDELRCGYVDSASVDDGGILRLDADGIPEPVASWRNAGGLVQPSIEYFNPVYDEYGNLIDGFRMPDGKICPEPVLKCLTLLGNDAPAVKGLPDLPVATYSHLPTLQFSQRCVRQFANASSSIPLPTPGDIMDRAAMLQALQALGMDVSGITDVVPDQVIKAMLDTLQKMQANPSAATGTDAAGNQTALPAPDPTQQMADLGGGIGSVGGSMGGGTGAALGGGIPGIGTQQPSSVVLKFADNTPAAIAAGLGQFGKQVMVILTQLQTQANQTQANLAAINGAANRQAHSAKFADVTAFVEMLAKPDANKIVRLQPAQKPGLIALLMKCDNGSVKKFADGSGQGTELEEMKRIQLATLPKIRLGDKVPDPAPATPGAKNNVSGGMDPDRRTRMLQATPMGRKVLAGQAK